MENRFKNQMDVIIDNETSLMWQQTGSSQDMSFVKTHAYIQGLNDASFGGFNDWRLPTSDELKTTMFECRNESGFFVYPVFNQKQECIWSSDKNEDSTNGDAWYVSFHFGGVFPNYFFDHDFYVRAVRSMK